MIQTERILTYDRIDANRRATRILIAVFALALLPVAAYVALYLTEVAALLVGVAWTAAARGDPFVEGNWLIFVSVMAVVAVSLAALLMVLQYRYAARAILRITRAQPVSRDDELELHRQVENLCIAAGIPQPSLYVIESTAVNAFSTGMNPQHAFMVVTRGLLALLDRPELEGVLAHEVSQIASYDVRLGTLVAAGVALMRMPFVIMAALVRFPFKLHWIVGVGVLLYLGVPMLLSIPGSIVFGLELMKDNTLEGVIFLSAGAITLYIFLLAPLISHAIRAAVARRSELLADADAVLLTRNHEGLARALIKMEAAGTSGLRVGGSTAHLWVMDPLGEEAPWWDRLLRTHSPVDERVSTLSAMGSGITPPTLQQAREAGRNFRQTTNRSLESAAYASEEFQAPTADGGTEATLPSPVGYRLSAKETIVHQNADAASPEVERLPEGSLIAVQQSEGDFLYVITPKDRFGYIAGTAPMTPIELGQ